MSNPEDVGGSQAAGAIRSYKLESGTFRDRQYQEGVLLLDEERKLLELRQSAGKSKEETVVARFRVEPHAELSAKGTVLKVSELSVTLESAAAAAEVLEILRRPSPEPQEAKVLSQAESTIKEFLEDREEAMAFLSRMKVDPRAALLGVESMWAANDSRGPFEAAYSGYSKRVADSLEEAKSFLASAQTTLGARVVGRLYALTYTIGSVQNALFQGDSDMAQELAALQELGVAATAQELGMEKASERLLLRAHPALEALSSVALPPSEALS